MLFIAGCAIYTLFTLFQVVFKKGSHKGPSFAEPFCRKCDHDLRSDWDSSMRCPACGKDLSKNGAVYFGQHQKPKSVFRTFLVFIPIILFIGAPQFLPQLDRWFNESIKSNAALVANPPVDMLDTWHWDDLERRYNAGSLSQDEVQQLISNYTAVLQTIPMKKHDPMYMSGPWISRLILSGQITEPTRSDFLKAYYGSPIVTAKNNKNKKNGSLFSIRFPHNNSVDLNGTLDPCAILMQIAVEDEPGKTVDYRDPRDRSPLKTGSKPVPVNLHMGAFVRINKSLSPGEHVLIFTFDTRYDPGRKWMDAPDLTTEPLLRYPQQTRVRVTVDEDGNINLTNQDMPNDPAGDHETPAQEQRP
jgi:hypothetical protein